MSTNLSSFQFCPRCKSDKISSLNGHKHLCLECQFEYFHNTAAAVAAIICCDDEILLTVRAQEPEKDQLDLPGGFVDHNETLEEALSRELKEELSVDITNWQYFYSGANTYHYKDVIYQTCDVVFVCHLTEKPILNADVAEIAAYQWVRVDELDSSRIAFVSLRKAIEQFKRSHA
ncbi:NUDIX domain-containing protein [Paraglaciecola aquimarina]|uniref:NUDIX domain-containing protein n=1 Tax=Paraglaciecola aquimarina TaxID=1235557 RepID=A0ABU3SVE6_9ALTE|nr:NUDIX domain-containing protein [Paraglaciecola aquimarina]MDU0353977.1 NUDIX domain-containing protein [Paraglaciecola aquimarina]